MRRLKYIMDVRRAILYLVMMVLLCADLNAQMDTIYLKNPSMEGRPAQGQPPGYWFPCGFGAAAGQPDRNTPDTQPAVDTIYFNVTKKAHDGKTYVGLVVRDDDSREGISQMLLRPLVSQKCYEMTLVLARSLNYFSQSRRTEQDAFYTKPCVLTLWGGYGSCSKVEKLWESSEIAHSDWKKYTARFEPTQRLNYLTLEIQYYARPVLFPYNGNILVDNLSHIVEVECDKPIEDVASVETPQTTPLPQDVAPKPKVRPPKPKTPPKTLQETVEKDELKVGQIIKIEQLFFKADKSIFEIESYKALDNLYDFLNSNRELIVEIGGHTNMFCADSFCDELSMERAQAVVKYLVGKGIQNQRLISKGYGKKHPLTFGKTRVAQRKNQRVEIKILSLGS